MSIFGLKEVKDDSQHVLIRQLGNMLQELKEKLNGKLTLKTSIEHTIIEVTNNSFEPKWVEVPHNLKRTPTCFLYKDGDIGAIGGIEYYNDRVLVHLRGWSTVRIVLL